MFKRIAERSLDFLTPDEKEQVRAKLQDVKEPREPPRPTPQNEAPKKPQIVHQKTSRGSRLFAYVRGAGKSLSNMVSSSPQQDHVQWAHDNAVLNANLIPTYHVLYRSLISRALFLHLFFSPPPFPFYGLVSFILFYPGLIMTLVLIQKDLSNTNNLYALVAGGLCLAFGIMLMKSTSSQYHNHVAEEGDRIYQKYIVRKNTESYLTDIVMPQRFVRNPMLHLDIWISGAGWRTHSTQILRFLHMFSVGVCVFASLVLGLVSVPLFRATCCYENFSYDTFRFPCWDTDKVKNMKGYRPKACNVMVDSSNEVFRTPIIIVSVFGSIIFLSSVASMFFFYNHFVEEMAHVFRARQLATEKKR